MPLYEYRCEECSRRFTLLVGMVAQPAAQQCPRCGSAQLRKLISRFRVGRSEEDILESIPDPESLGNPEDPRAMADWMRRVGQEMGDDLGDDFEELVEEAVREEEMGATGSSGEAAAASDGAAGDSEL
ncbi:MAG: FmdB family zinc ribbon protein [Armatimonadota bacterium]